MGPIRIFLADDHPLVRSGIRSTLSQEADLLVVGETDNGDDTLRLCAELQVDVLLLDLSMPGPSPVEIVNQLKRSCPNTKVLVLTAFDDDAYVRSMMSAGVSGYSLKDEAPELLPQAIRKVVEGGRWLSQSIVDKLVSWSNQGFDHKLPRLTSREQQLLMLLSQGLDNTRIAERMGIAEQTVRNYASRLYDKIGVRSRSEAMVWARRHGFTKA